VDEAQGIGTGNTLALLFLYFWPKYEYKISMNGCASIDHSCFLTCNRHMLQRKVGVCETCSSLERMYKLL
jgi:hypothetical protein